MTELPKLSVPYAGHPMGRALDERNSHGTRQSQTKSDVRVHTSLRTPIGSFFLYFSREGLDKEVPPMKLKTEASERAVYLQRKCLNRQTSMPIGFESTSLQRSTDAGATSMIGDDDCTRCPPQVERYSPEVGDRSKKRVKREINKIVTPGSRTLRGPGIPKGNDQVIYSNAILDPLSCTTQLSKADSSSSTAGDQARNLSSSRQPTPTEGRKKMRDHMYYKPWELRQTLIPDPSGYVSTSSRARVLHRKTKASPANYNRPCDRADIRQSSEQLPQQQSRPPADQTHRHPRGKSPVVPTLLRDKIVLDPESQSNPQHRFSTTTFTSNWGILGEHSDRTILAKYTTQLSNKPSIMRQAAAHNFRFTISAQPRLNIKQTAVLSA
ncbi:hypothetical protein CRG98_025880 [Punica granatum]|uniref:Uncharacterized protein n=1 Tax=Punica granatum TaxID=22663 RepID=A0A2I0JCW0_PUNGR|nr:hypothetical protein CRG98_025880 [Punica granatum]